MNKKLMFLTAILVAGAAAVLVMEKAGERKGDPRLGNPIMENGAVAGVDSIEIAKGESSVKLVLDAEKLWRMSETNGFPADVSKVTRLLDDFTKSGVQVLAGSSQDAMNDFGFDVATKVIVRSGEKEIVTVNLANTRERGGQYISFGGEYKVYLISQALNALPDASAWEMKTLVNIKPEQVKRVEFLPVKASGRKPVVLSREKAEDPVSPEQIPDGSKETGSVRSHESILSALSFTGRVDPDNEEYKSAMASASSVNVVLFNGSTFDVKVGSVGDSNKKYFLKIAAEKGENTPESDSKDIMMLNDLMSRFAFEVPAYVGGKFEKGFDDMLEKKGS